MLLWAWPLASGGLLDVPARGAAELGTAQLGSVHTSVRIVIYFQSPEQRKRKQEKKRKHHGMDVY